MGKYDEEVKKAMKEGKMEQLTTDIINWQEEGQTVCGRVHNIVPFTGGKFDTEVNQYIIDTDDGLKSTILGSAADKQLKGVELIGRTVYIEYRGKKNLDDGRQVNNFRILVH